ncbi:MAG TPA: chromate efflux transporter [Anaerolineales bacterium]|nr:chromate efflux transporter [Anaerolineales bacterium]
MSNTPVLEVLMFFLRLGLTSFGGPAAHIALMRAELVERRRWISEADFLELLGAANLIPGPNSTELAMHLGYRRAGWGGLIAAGIGFIVPAMLIVLGFAWAYVAYGATPPARALLYGIQPVVIAIVAQALLGLGRAALRDRRSAVIAALTLLGAALGLDELSLLLAALIVTVAWHRWRQGALAGLALPATGWSAPIWAALPFSRLELLWVFLKIGSVLYGSGYVLLAFLQSDFVERLGWLTSQQLLDAIAVGQVTPGPVFTTATFIGYLLDGWAGALVATLGIFLPAFVFVAISIPLVERARRSPLVGALLAGVTAASLALMAAVTIELGFAALIDPLTVALALAAGSLLWRTRLNPTWLLLAGGLAGLIRLFFA